MNNWSLVKIPILRYLFPKDQVEETNYLLHSLTAESSFLIRTFFFILFGFSINLKSIANQEVILIGGSIVLILLIVRFLYLRFFLKENIYRGVVFIPRGLITILLFYKIPDALKLRSFNGAILFFIILVTSLIMMLGILFYRKKGRYYCRGNIQIRISSHFFKTSSVHINIALTLVFYFFPFFCKIKAIFSGFCIFSNSRYSA